MGILKKRRDSFLPTYPLYNIKREKATKQPLTTNLVLEFYKSSSLSFGLSVFLSFSLSLFLSFCLSLFLSVCGCCVGLWPLLSKDQTIFRNHRTTSDDNQNSKRGRKRKSVWLDKARLTPASPPPIRPPPLTLEKVLLRLVPA